ncbi:hypothetical protein Clacol_001693 [Clathrus columnatus]|uniref:BRCT domain-containing protein n=1 Tax=Clathrus columnatus TaxID=1419009 RepID=A0AAV5A4H0_9AGAM|nr:hypothetical protein Clacol_001693 [Clathrus columnatus]
MDKFILASKPLNSTSTDNNPTGKARAKSYKYNPYPIPKSKEKSFETWKENKRIQRQMRILLRIMAPLCAKKNNDDLATSKNILTTLKDKSNPITHSLKGIQKDHVDSCVTGHQLSDGRIPTVVIKSRTKKLREQRIEKGRNECGILAGTRIYIGGYLAGTTDLEMKRLVILEGGEIQKTAASATHIITSQGLSASKTQKYLNGNHNTHIVTPEWVTDSISSRKRKKEWDYAVFRNTFAYGHGLHHDLTRDVSTDQSLNTEVSLVAPDGSITANFLAFGATTKNLWVRDKFGNWRGFDNISDYTQQTFGRQFFGPVVGRYANRIKNATFSIPPSANPPANGPNVYHVPANEHNGLNSLHGGPDGYDLRLWNVTAQSKNSVTFSLLDPNGTEGFPGNQITHVSYTLENNSKWKIAMHATVDHLSPILLRNLDAYNGAENLDKHFAQFKSSRYIQTDGILIPTGTFGAVKGTPLDFNEAKSIGQAINATVGLNLCGTGCVGFDNCWLYDDPQDKKPNFSVWSTVSGIK